MSKVSYGDITIDLTTLPEASVLALVSRGLTRYLGSEVSSKAITHFKDVPEASDADKTAYADAVRAEFLQHLLAGTVGQGRATGPRKDPVETEAKAIAAREVRETLKTHKLGFTKPAKDAAEKFTPYVLFGNGSKKTMAEMVATRLAGHGERIRKTAAKNIADAKRIAEKAAEAVTGEGVKTAEDLGL